MRKIIVFVSAFLIIITLVTIMIFSLFPKKYENLITKYSDKYNLPKYLVASVINIESSFDEKSVSSVGAVGLMQVLPTTAFDMADRLKINKSNGLYEGMNRGIVSITQISDNTIVVNSYAAAFLTAML